MQTESWVVVGLVAALWFVRELIPVLAKAIRGHGGEAMERVLAEGHGSGTFQAPYHGTGQLPPGQNHYAPGYEPPPQQAGDTGRYAAVGYGEPSSPSAVTGRYAAQLGPAGPVPGEHDHLVSRNEFLAFQTVVQAGLAENSSRLQELGRSMVVEIKELTRAVGRLEGRGNGK